jgi:gluconolactonase
MSALKTTILAEGLQFPEGPVSMADGSVLVVEIAAGRVSRVGKDRTVTIVAETGGGPNGLAQGPDGLLYCCNNGGFAWRRDGAGRLLPYQMAEDYSGGAIQRIHPTNGKVETLYTAAGEVALRGPNDLVFDAHGGFWFTDLGKVAPRSRDRTGVFYAMVDGDHIHEAIFPMDGGSNGIGLSPDGATLYVAETSTCMLWAFDIETPGRIRQGSKRLLYRPEGLALFDSLAIEADGNICVATLLRGGVSVISPEGKLVEFIATGDFYTTNLC